MADNKEYRLAGEPELIADDLDAKELAVQIVFPDDIQINYADGFHVVSNDELFILSFLQVQQPIIFNQQSLDEIEFIENLCIARIALSPKRMAALIKALSGELDRFVEAHRKQQKDAS